MWTMGALEGSFKLAREELRAEQSESQLVHGTHLAQVEFGHVSYLDWPCAFGLHGLGS